MDDSPVRCRPGCPWCGALPELFAADRSAGRDASVQMVMVVLSALVVLAALGAALSAAG
ncbi:hypothetical protein [Streptomyces mirabilis]|uniref:hypothetical protein n=1 Tax=Streptomyces mirabilis TaxID=68239 RepID=UPI003691E1B7